MKENIRTEAEKVLIEKGMNCAKLRNTFTLDGNDDSFLDRIINAMLDFHAQQLEKDNWVSVSERLPNQNENVLCIFECGECDVDYINGNEIWQKNFPLTPTYWMPLPKSPITTQTL